MCPPQKRKRPPRNRAPERSESAFALEFTRGFAGYTLEILPHERRIGEMEFDGNLLDAQIRIAEQVLDFQYHDTVYPLMDGFSGEVADDAGEVFRRQIHPVGIEFDASFGTEILGEQFHKPLEILGTAVLDAERRLRRRILRYRFADTIDDRTQDMPDYQVGERRYGTFAELFVEIGERFGYSCDMIVGNTQRYIVVDGRQHRCDELDVDILLRHEIAVESQNIEFAIAARMKFEYRCGRYEHHVLFEPVFGEPRRERHLAARAYHGEKSIDAARVFQLLLHDVVGKVHVGDDSPAALDKFDTAEFALHIIDMISKKLIIYHKRHIFCKYSMNLGTL